MWMDEQVQYINIQMILIIDFVICCMKRKRNYISVCLLMFNFKVHQHDFYIHMSEQHEKKLLLFRYRNKVLVCTLYNSFTMFLGKKIGNF